MKKGGRKQTRYTLNVTYGGMQGIVLYPDNYLGPDLVTWQNYTKETFPVDCIFLPVAGCRVSGSIVEFVGEYGIGQYWTCSPVRDAGKEEFCYTFIFGSAGLDLANPRPRNYDPRYLGSSIRLIRECQ